MSLDLTVDQSDRLDSIAEEEPDAKVVGWSYVHAGPLVRWDGKTRAVDELGRLKFQRAI